MEQEQDRCSDGASQSANTLSWADEDAMAATPCMSGAVVRFSRFGIRIFISIVPYCVQ